MTENNQDDRKFWIDVYKSVEKHLRVPKKNYGFFITLTEKALILVSLKYFMENFYNGSDLNSIFKELSHRKRVEQKNRKKYLKSIEAEENDNK